MRDIKFRAWDKYSERFRGSYIDDLKMDYGTGQIYSGNMNVTDKLILCQYTGLKDKNEKDIYEGDIIEIIIENEGEHGFNLSMGNRYVIDWEEPFCGFVLRKVSEFYKRENLDASYYGLVSINVEICIGYYSKIIGNIYENPELLEKGG